MTEQTTPDKALSADPNAEAEAPARASAGFGGRTDAHAGMSLGLAPASFPTTRQVADDTAPDSLGAPRDGEQSTVVQHQTVHEVPKKEHPFKRMMREQAERHAEAQAAKAAPAEPIEAELIEDGDFTSSSESSSDEDTSA